MNPNARSYPIWNWGKRGGLVADRFDPSRLAIDDLWVCQNAIEDGGDLVKRGGTRRRGTPSGSATVRALHAFFATDAATVRMFRVCGTAIQWLNGSSWDTVAGGTAFSGSAYGWFSSYQNQVWYSDGTNAYVIAATATPPTKADWRPLGGAIVPKMHALNLNRQYFNRADALHSIYFSELGVGTTAGASSWYNAPDDQAGLAPVNMVRCQDWVGLIHPNFVINLSGAGPNDHTLKRFPKNAQLLSWRAVADCGKFIAMLTTEGLAVFDGWHDVQLLDVDGKVNWWDMKDTTPELIHMVRHGRKVRTYFASRGKIALSGGLPTLADGRARTLAAVDRVISVVAARRDRATLATIYAGSSYTNKFYEWDLEKNKITGPHDGAHLCGCEDEPAYGKHGDLWLGSSQADGKVWTADDPIFLDDDDGTGTVGTRYPFFIRTGCFGLDPFENYQLEKVKVYHSLQNIEGGKASVELYFGHAHQAKWSRPINLDMRAAEGGEMGNPFNDVGREWADVWESGIGQSEVDVLAPAVGRFPQIGIYEESSQFFALKGLKPWFSEV